VKTPPSLEEGSGNEAVSQRHGHASRATAIRTGVKDTFRHAATQAQRSQRSSDTTSTLSTPIDTPQHSPPKEERSHFGDVPYINTTDIYKPATGNDGSEPDCTACNFSVPKSLTAQLPSGAPGSPTKDGRNSNGSPVLRTREAVIACDGHHDTSDDDGETEAHQDLHPTQFSPPLPVITNPTAFTSPCHTHTLTYLTTRTSPSPHTYSLLRRASIRTLSSELLPRGASAGPFCFGDAVAGYTIAYVFRVPDPHARGSRRTHALLALAGKDANRAFRASPVVWRAFERIANTIVDGAERGAKATVAAEAEGGEGDDAAVSPRTLGGGGDRRAARDVYATAQPRQSSSAAQQQRQQQQRQREPHHQRTFTPVSSFLSGRDVDPDGYPMRKPNLWGRQRQRSLAELVGNEYLFAELHAEFVALLQMLGRTFGGVPVDEEGTVVGSESPAGGSEGDGDEDEEDGEEEDEDEEEEEGGNSDEDEDEDEDEEDDTD